MKRKSETFDRLRAALADRYALEREVGRGGMATVYLARDLRHDRPVAVKVLNPELGAAIGSGRFEREVLIAANLSHPHILPVHDSGETNGLLFYVMPFVEGESLRQRLDREYQLSLEDALDITYDVAAALSFAHSRGVIHRDVKPENILLHSGQAVVADFGIARAVSAAGSDRITHTGLAVGTPKYMSPEQAAGNTELDQRSDLYSLACVLYEMLAGQPPHLAATPQAILAQKLTQERPARLDALRSSVTPELDAVIMRALSSIAADRYHTCQEFVDALRAGAAGIPTEIRRRTPKAARRPIPWRTTLAGVGATALVVAAVLTGRAWLGSPPATDRLTLAVFPFRPTGGGAEEWSEALGDLLATALDGTPGVSVADPWTLWRPLRPDRNAIASPPGPEDAGRLAAGAGAGRFVLGSVVQTGDELNLTVRVYRADTEQPGRTLTASGSRDSLPALVQRLAVGVITQVWEEEQLPDVRSVESYATHSAGALKAHLDARGAMRRGLVDSANVYIDRALALDSGYALALLDGAAIKAWVQQMRGQFFTGLLPLLERADTLADSLSERNRLRIRSMLALTRTDGVAAAEAARRILQIDSTDLAGWDALAQTHLSYGWQYGATPEDARAAAERVVQLDSTYIPGLVRRAALAVIRDGDGDAGRQLARLSAVDTTVVPVLGALYALRGLRADLATYDTLVEGLVERPPAEWLPTLRAMRNEHPERAERLLRRVIHVGRAGEDVNAARGELFRLWIAQGRFGAVDSLRRSGVLEDVPWLHRNLQRWLVAAALADVGDPDLTRSVVDDLAAYIPVDSAQAFFYNYPVWWTGWLVAAYHATHGDTAITRRWSEAIATLPAGGTPRDYRGGLQQDLAARVAARRDDLDAAARAAADAFARWSIHTDNDWEALAEPAMRLHYAMILKAQRRPDSAAALLRSLIPPTTWMGFLTARAAFELGQLAEDRRAWQEAGEHYALALRYWSRSDETLADWRDRARAGLERVARRSG